MKTHAGWTIPAVLVLMGGALLLPPPLHAGEKISSATTSAEAEATKPPIVYLGAGAEALAQIDIDFSKMSAAQGAAKAFDAYLADDAVQLPDNEKPITGKPAICAHLEDMDKRRLILTWRPTRAEVAGSGELGYTFGIWKLRAKHRKELVAVGNYTTVWKKSAADGSWKAVVDIGNQSRM